MIWTTILLYSAAAIYLGWRAHRAQAASTDAADAWTAGRSLSAGSVGLSISAGFMSVSWSCVYAVQLFYGYGLGALWLITIPWLVSLWGIHQLARRYRQLPAFSQPEMVGIRFGQDARRTVAVALAFVFLVWGGAEIYVAAMLLSPGLGISPQATILGICVVVGIYATLGGFRAVVATDKLQYGVVAVYVLAMAWLTARGLALHDGGSWWPSAEVTGLRSGSGWSNPISPGWPLILLTLIAYLPGWLFETDLWVRVQAAKDASAARRGVLLAGVNALFFVGLLPLWIGVSALTLFPIEDGVAPAVIGNAGDAVFAALVTQYAPTWLAALVAIGLVAAAMSTIDTCANVVGLAVAYDLLAVHHRDHPERAARITNVGVMAALCVFALNTDSLWDLFYLSGGILTTAVAFPVAAVVLPGVSSKGVRASSLAGLVGTSIAYLLESRGLLLSIEPAAIAESELGYILWGLAAAAGGYVVGAMRE